ncbi:hypothetical protein V1512DRAFT_246465 [Lipomyces arxii]|uniref:uncharacterized protein n=1 Tax=Lipomyces arxii TaxID=56418 RepID=UPI0034CF30E2
MRFCARLLSVFSKCLGIKRRKLNGPIAEPVPEPVSVLPSHDSDPSPPAHKPELDFLWPTLLSAGSTLSLRRLVTTPKNEPVPENNAAVDNTSISRRHQMLRINTTDLNRSKYPYQDFLLLSKMPKPVDIVDMVAREKYPYTVERQIDDRYAEVRRKMANDEPALVSATEVNLMTARKPDLMPRRRLTVSADDMPAGYDVSCNLSCY